MEDSLVIYPQGEFPGGNYFPPEGKGAIIVFVLKVAKKPLVKTVNLQWIQK